MNQAISSKYRNGSNLIWQWFPRQMAAWVGFAGMLILSILLVVAAFPQIFYTYDPREMVNLPLQPPGEGHLLGTNDIGQDLFSELVAGTRASLLIGLVVAVVSVGLGIFVGIVSGYNQGFLGTSLVRIMDLILVLPFLPLVIVISAYLGPSQRNVILVLILFFWATPARLIRARVLTLLNQPYIEAARALGADSVHIMVTHIWPGVRTLALVQVILIASATILAEASLSFLGLGDPSAKSWGTMLYFARASGAFLSQAWKWWVLPTGLIITLTVLSFVMIGYGLEGRLEPFIKNNR